MFSPNTQIFQSIFDHLAKAESSAHYGGIAQLKRSVMQNLEWLLNTRRRSDGVPSGLKQVNRSLAVYGLPDFSTFNPESDADCDRICEALRAAIELFEPRLENVRVITEMELEKDSQDKSNESSKKPVIRKTISFHIFAMLKVEPMPEKVRFDTELQLRSGTYEVEEK